MESVNDSGLENSLIIPAKHTTMLEQYFLALAGLGLLAALYVLSIHNFLLFHSIAEVFSIVIACGIFMVVWNSRRFLEQNYFLIIGIAFLFVAVVDFLHALAYDGIGIFQNYGVNLPTQLWIGGRYLQASSFFIAPFFIDKKIRTSYVYLFYFGMTSLLLLSIFEFKIFPDCFIEGRGLTPFKIISEYTISVILFFSIIFIYRKRERFGKKILLLLIASVIVNIASEMMFTLYISVYEMINILGHYLKIISFYLVYKAIIEHGLKNPYEMLFKKLEKSERALRLTRFSVDHSEDLLFWFRPNGKISDVNDSTCRKLDYSRKELTSMTVSELKSGINIDEITKELRRTEGNGNFRSEHVLKTKSGNSIYTEVEFENFKFGGDEYFCAFARDITKRKLAEEALLESEKRFKILADIAPVMIWMTDNRQMCVYCNKRWLEFTGRSMENELGEGWTESIHPDDLNSLIDVFGKAFSERQEYNLEYRIKRKDGQYRWIYDTGVPRFTHTGSFLGYIGSCIDITDSKLAREALELSLKEKVVLLKEVHHRVKNNLQVISSLFRLQADYIKDSLSKEIFNECQNRVKSMALVHEKLYLSKNFSNINLADYINELVSNLLISYRFSREKFMLHIEITEVELEIDFAINLGLILNELISNVFKYAFPEGKSFDGGRPVLSLRLVLQENNKILLSVKDNGVGFPENIDFKNSDSLGLQLVTSLVDQLRGDITLHRNGGTEFNISIEISNNR